MNPGIVGRSPATPPLLWRRAARSRRIASSACLSLLVAGLIAGGTAGCTSAVQSGSNTALDGVDLVQMTDDMAMKLASSPPVNAEIDARGPMRIVVQPVENRMEAEILTRSEAEAFTGRVRTLLSKHAPDRYVWVMNRDAWYSLRGQELEGVDPGPSPDAINPEYALTARFSSLTNEDRKGRSASYLCIYELTSLADRRVIWSDKYELKKVVVKGFLD